MESVQVRRFKTFRVGCLAPFVAFLSTYQMRVISVKYELKRSGLEITFPKFPIMVIGDHDFLPIKQKSGRSDSKTIATTY